MAATAATAAIYDEAGGRRQTAGDLAADGASCHL
jgi:hypothetical protein